MFKSYLRIAWRNLWKYRLFSLVNIIGLGLAMAFCFLILIQLQGSFEKDTFHPYPDRTYRILTDAVNKQDKTFSFASASIPLAAKLKNGQSGIEKVTQVIRGFDANLNSPAKTLKVSGIYVDPAFYDIFGFPLEKGKPAIAPFTVVLSHETAERFFGNEDPIGKTLQQRGKGTFTVTGVFAPLRGKKSHLESDLAVSMASYAPLTPGFKPDDWLNISAYTFVLLHKGTRPEALDRALWAIVKDNSKTVDFQQMKGLSFRKQGLSDISPAREELMNNPGVEPWDKILVNIIMMLVLISLAVFNYTNLTLTRSLSRAREVGVRKVTGAHRWQLIMQFLLEAVITSCLAFGVGYLGLYAMRSFLHLGWLSWEVQHPYVMWAIWATFTIITGLIAGIVPARLLSSYKPVQVLKGNLMPVAFGRVGLRKALIVVQFVVSLVFMVFSATMHSQFRYMANDNDNFNRKNMLNIAFADSARGNYKLLLNEIAFNAGIERIGLASAALSEQPLRVKISRYDARHNVPNLQDAYKYAADANFIENMQLRFIAGKNLPPAGLDTAKGRFVVLNEKAVQALGLGNPKEAVGQTVLLDSTQVIVAGVVKNFCFMRYELPVTPLVLQYDPQAFNMLSVRVTEGVTHDNIIAPLTAAWKRLYPYEPFNYSWQEEELYVKYMANGDMKLFAVLIFVVFTIASLGLLGIVTYTTEKRMKEVGIRKVMGAGVLQLTGLLSWSFLKLVLVAALIGLPLGGFLGWLFLEIFTWHAGFEVWIYLTSFSSLLLVAFFTVGIQTYKAALVNPAVSLRAE
jgi:putative ABC transport system permease protein